MFQARDTVKQTDVAIKILNLIPETEVEEKREERFLREARMHLNHPNIVHIFELNYYEPLPCTYIVMELLEGQDLRKELEENGPMHPQRAIPLVIQVLLALDTAHQHNVIHRDLKPENLFIHMPETEMEAIKVLDFGIARVHTEHSLSITGQILGTHKYLAPEYIQDDIITPKLDIYQMGLVLIELLTGTPVIQTDHALTGLRQHIRGSVEIPVALLESSLGPIILQSLHNDPKERFASAVQFAQALSSIALGSIPFGEALEEKIALNVYFKGSMLLQYSSEEDWEEDDTIVEIRQLQENTAPLLLFTAITIAIGIIVAITWL